LSKKLDDQYSNCSKFDKQHISDADPPLSWESLKITFFDLVYLLQPLIENVNISHRIRSNVTKTTAPEIYKWQSF